MDGFEEDKVIRDKLTADNVHKFKRKGPWRPIPITASQLLAHPPPPPKVIIPGLLPVGLSYLAGRPKSGKSLLAAQIARTVVDDDAMLFGLEVGHGPVVYIDLENSKWRIFDRLSKGGLLDGPGAKRLHFVLEWNAGNRGELLVLLDELHPVVVIIDVWAKFRAPLDAKVDRYEFDQAELAWLHSEANERDIAILLVGHRTKFEDPDDPFNNFAGSTAVMGGVDTAIAFGKVPGETSLRELNTRGRDTGDAGWIVRVDANLNCSKVCDADQYVSPALAGYIKAMGKQIWTQAALAKEMGVTQPAVSKALAQFYERGLVELTTGGSRLTEVGLLVLAAL